MRPVPPGVFPDSSYITETQELVSESPIDSCKTDEWWREAMVVADEVENMPRKLDLGKEVSFLAQKCHLLFLQPHN